jgi:hypothetical protein
MTMPRTRLLAIAGLPLLALLLMAQAPAVPPKKPLALAQQQKAAAAVAAQQQKAQAAAEAKKAAAEAKAAAAAAKKAALAQPEKSPATHVQKNAAKKREPLKYALEDYYKVWDVTAKTTRADIVARFGEPQRIGDWASKPFYYFNGTLTFFFTSDDTVGTMIVGNSFEPMPPNRFPPELIEKAFIGRSRDDVLKTFGPANSVSSENYRYWPKAGVYKVEFQCYDFKRYVCGQMLVQF